MYHVLGVIFLLIGLGVALRAGKVFPPETARLLNRFVLFISFPCLVFRSLHGAEMDIALWTIPLPGFLLISGAFIASFFLGTRFLSLKIKSAASFAMGAAFGNTAFLGYPFIMALRGESALPPAIFFDQMANFLALYSVGVAFCVYSLTGRFSFRNLWEILKLPPFIAFWIALVMQGTTLPPIIMEAVERLADSTVPLIMVAIGLSLSPTHLSRHLKPLLAGTLIKLAFLPLLFLGVVRFLPLPELYREVMILQAATPTLMTSYALASLYSLDLDLASSLIFLTTLLSLVSLPLWSLLITYV